MDINKIIGENIRLLRRLNGLTLESLSRKLGKSQATISKYETGAVSVDLGTLYDIANVFGITMEQLVTSPKIKYKNAGNKSAERLFFTDGRYYTYFTVDTADRLFLGVMNISDNHNVTYYSTVKNQVDYYYSCKHLYYGKVEESQGYAHFFLDNQVNSAEKLFLNISTPFTTDNISFGIACGISEVFRMPMAFKILISKTILRDGTDDILDSLRICKEDIKKIKEYNLLMFTPRW